MNIRFFVFTILIFLMGAIFVFTNQNEAPSVQIPDREEGEIVRAVEPTVTPRAVPDEYRLSGGVYAGQTFNNCGPASLSMALSYQNRNISQAELASILRPFNNPLGGVDDKAVFAHELVKEAQNQGFESIERPNGTIPMLQQLLAEDVSIIVRTWLNPGEDIGHYRVLTGYNKTTNQIYMDDSYNGPNLSMSEDVFMDVWQPFNYGYILVYPEEKSQVVSEIVGGNIDETVAWENALERAEKELSQNQTDEYALFNKAIALYYLGEPSEATDIYENVASQLPGRMLWYQPEPIYAYYETEEYDQAVSHIDSILNNGNRAFSELHLIKGKIYEAQGNIEMAQNAYQTALEYNINYKEAREALQNLS